MKKTLALVVALMMVLSVFSVIEAEEERMTITWIGFDKSPTPDGEIERYLEERFNVNLECANVDGLSSDSINMYLASGGTFDVINNAIGTGLFNTCVEQQLVRSIPTEWLEEYLPTWCAKCVSISGVDLETQMAQCSLNGELYAVPCMIANFVEPGIFLVRQDWLDNLGLEMPTDIESFHEVLRAFTFDDPDGNGIDDTYGMNGNGTYYFNYVFAAYGIMKNSYYKLEDGSVVYTSATEPYKEVMKILQSWYKEGIIDPETITDDRTKQREKWGHGLFGILPDNASWCSSGQLQNMVLEQNPNAVISFMPAFEGAGSMVNFPNAQGCQGAFMFGFNTSDEKCIKIMEIKEAMAADEALYNRCYWGVEGVDYEDQNGFYYKLEQDSAKRMADGLGYWWGMQPKTFEQYGHEVMSEYVIAHTIAQSNKPVFMNSNFYVTGENVSKTLHGADVTSIANTYYADALMGNVDIDETWDSYIAELNAAGLDKITAEYEEMLAK